MPFHRLEYDRTLLESLLQEHSGNEQVSVRPRGSHLYIELDEGTDSNYVIARATEIGRNRYGVSFRNHSGKYEPMPISGGVEEVASDIAAMLAPYFAPRQ